jgi:hypothetical protein
MVEDDADRSAKISEKPVNDERLNQTPSENQTKTRSNQTEWTEEEDIKLFQMYKEFGTRWAVIVKYFKGKTKDSLRNRFYSTLRRIARKKCKDGPTSVRTKNLLELVDDAIKYGHNCFCKRGRPKKDSRKNDKVDVVAEERKQEEPINQDSPKYQKESKAEEDIKSKEKLEESKEQEESKSKEIIQLDTNSAANPLSLSESIKGQLNTINPQESYQGPSLNLTMANLIRSQQNFIYEMLFRKIEGRKKCN